MSYTINPNAKNKWARNAENTMDLSLETDASSVYLDNGRTLEQELGKGSMVSNVATVDSAMSKVTDGTLDGAYESCVFNGKSLVNLIHGERQGNFYVNNTHGGGQGFWIDNNTSMIKPNTKYLIIVNIIKNTGCEVIINNSEMNMACFTDSVRYEAGETGLKKVVLTSKPDLASCTTILRSYTYRVGEVRGTLQAIEYQQGMENWDIPYFEGICDVKMPILRNVGKNLSDGKLETGRYTQTEGEKFTDASAVRTINKIKVKPSTKYCLRTMDGTAIYNISEYHDGAYVGYKTSGSKLVFTTSPTTNELHISFKTNNINLQYQLEEGSIATTYEDHKTNILHTPETVTLRSLPSGVRDELNLMTGEYIKRIGEIVLDGSQSMDADSNGVFVQVNDAKRFLNYTGKMACDKLPIMPTYGHLANVENGISGYTNANGYLGQNWLYIKINNSINKNEVKQWLTQNPITVQYELVEPIITIVESLTTPFAYENGHVILESGYEGQSLLPTLEYSTVVNKTGLVENVAKTIQRQEKQLTMLEKMLIQNIINLDYNNTLLTLKNEMEEML